MPLVSAAYIPALMCSMLLLSVLSETLQLVPLLGDTAESGGAFVHSLKSIQ